MIDTAPTPVPLEQIAEAHQAMGRTATPALAALRPVSPAGLKTRDELCIRAIRDAQARGEDFMSVDTISEDTPMSETTNLGMRA